MSIQELENAVTQLSQEERRQFADWLADFLAEQEADEWDRQIERDIKAGRFDAMAEQAHKDYKAGRCKPL